MASLATGGFRVACVCMQACLPCRSSTRSWCSPREFRSTECRTTPRLAPGTEPCKPSKPSTKAMRIAASPSCRCLDTFTAAGHPVPDFVTRPLSRDQRSFKEEPRSSSDIAARLKRHLRAAKVCRGQTVYGTRRGSMQHAVHTEGQSVEHVGQQAQIRTPGIIRRCLDRQGHTGM